MEPPSPAQGDRRPASALLGKQQHFCSELPQQGICPTSDISLAVLSIPLPCLVLSTQRYSTWQFHVCTVLRDSGPHKSSRKAEPGTEMPSPPSQEELKAPAAQRVPPRSQNGPGLSPVMAPSLCCPRGHGISAHPSSFLLQPFPAGYQCQFLPSEIQHPHRTLPCRVEAVESPPQLCGERGQGKRSPNLIPARWDQHVGSSRSCQ